MSAMAPVICVAVSHGLLVARGRTAVHAVRKKSRDVLNPDARGCVKAREFEGDLPDEICRHSLLSWSMRHGRPGPGGRSILRGRLETHERRGGAVGRPAA